MVQRALRLPADVWSWLDGQAEHVGTNSSQLIREQVLRFKRERERWSESRAVSPRDDGIEP